MKRTGSFIFALMLLAAPVFAAELETAIDKNTIAAGDTTMLRVKVSPSARFVSLPKTRGLIISYSGMNSSMTIINGDVRSSAEVMFLVEAQQPGRYTIPAMVFELGGKRLSSRPMVLTVTAGNTRAGAGPSASLKASVELSRQRAYVGQPVILRYYLGSSNGMQVNGFETPVETSGFAVRKLERGEVEDTGKNAGSEPLLLHALIPLAQGRQTVGGGTAVVTEMDEVAFFSRQRRIVFEKRALEIVPLPEAGKPADFRGDTGDFTVEADFSSDAVKAYDEKKISVTVKGTGNFITLARPAFASVPGDCRVLYEDGASSIRLRGDRLIGEKKYTIVLIPEKPGRLNLGPIRLPFFNPDARSYQTAQTRPVAFDVKPGKTGGAGVPGEEKEPGPDFNPLFIALMVILIAGAVVFVVLWERRRYAGIVNGTAVRDRSETENGEGPREKNALAELSRAARSGDADAFLKAADRALESLRAGGGMEERIVLLKEKIYSFKFGGAQLPPEEIVRIEDEIRELARSGS